MNKIINLNGNAVELAKIKAISVNEYFGVGPENHQLRIEFKTRMEYVFNPNTTIYEKEYFNDTLLADYPNGDTARENYKEIIEIWEDSLEELE